MGDVETLILVSTALAGFGAVVQHFYDRFASNGLYRRTERRTREIPAQIGLEVEGALNRVAASQEAKYEEAARAAQADVQSSVKSAEMSIVRSVGVDRAMRAGVDRALSEAILGPALPLLRQFAPGLADQLEENPQLVDILLEHPLFKKYVEPRIRQFLGKPAESGGSDVNPFLKELGQ